MPLRTQTSARGKVEEPTKGVKRRSSGDQGAAAKVAKKHEGGKARQEEPNRVPGGKKDWLKDGPVDERRVRLLTKEVQEPKTDGKVVICYLQRDLRVQDNWALLLAQVSVFPRTGCKGVLRLSCDPCVDLTSVESFPERLGAVSCRDRAVRM